MAKKTVNTQEYLGKRLGDILVSIKKIERDDLEDALKGHQRGKNRIGEFLLQKNLITEDDLLRVLSLQLGIDYYEDLLLHASNVLSTSLSRSFIKRYNVVLLDENNHTVTVAVNDPFQFEVFENIRTFTKKELKIVLARKLDIMKLSDILAGEAGESADQVIEGLSEEGNNIKILGEVTESEQDVLDLANEAPIIRLVNLMITEALKQRASDIHIEPSDEGITVRYRIDGMLYNVLTPPKRFQQAIVSRVKIMANLNIAENRLPQDGRIKIKYGAQDVDIRVSIIPSVMGERVVMRLLIKDEKRFDISNLGMDDELLEQFQDVLRIPHGIIIVSGPTGCGKTTTLYAAIREINTTEKNIITIEDPVEYRIKGISQIQVNPKINLTFASGLRSILRQDPEVIMVGEIRDPETAHIAIQAAMTGHLVFSTVHTNDAASGIVRLIDMGIEPYLIASTVTCFLSQRLVRILCAECKKPKKFSPEVFQDEHIDSSLFIGKTLYQPEGCSKCTGTGFKGRVGIFEMIKINDDIRRMIIQRRDASFIRARAMEMGMKSMLNNGLQKVLEGVTSLEELLRVIRD